METEHQIFFRKNLAEEMTKQELIDRLVEYVGYTDKLKNKIEKYEEVNKITWDEIIGGISDYLEKEYKGLYNIPKEEFFHFIVCYIEEKHPNFIPRNIINLENQ